MTELVRYWVACTQKRVSLVDLFQMLLITKQRKSGLRMHCRRTDCSVRSSDLRVILLKEGTASNHVLNGGMHELRFLVWIGMPMPGASVNLAYV